MRLYRCPLITKKALGQDNLNAASECLRTAIAETV